MRDEEMERRCLNWARWKLGGSSGTMGYARVSPGMEPGGGRYREARIPTIDCEAEETDRGIAALDPDLRRTVEQYYLQPEGNYIKAIRLGIAEATLYRRIERAHQELSAWLQDRRRAADVERLRVMALQASVRHQ